MLLKYKNSRNAFNLALQRGFTLFELVLVLVLMSGITMIVAYSAQRAIDKVNYETSKAKINNISKALDYFAGLADRLPCPARPLPKANPAYGQEDCAWADNIANRINPTVSRTTAMTTLLPPPGDPTDENKVLIGRLPSYVQVARGVGPWIPLSQYVPALDKIGGSLILDQTGELPRYAVTRRLAMVNSGGDYGNITVRDSSNASVAGVDDDARYVVVLQSYRTVGCNAVATDDFENCGNNDSIFKVAPRSLGTGAGYFDDVVIFNNSIFDNKWLAADVDTGAAQGAVYIDAGVKNIGVQNTAPTAKLDIGAALRADTNVRAPLICDKTAPIPRSGSVQPNVPYNVPYNSPAGLVVTKTTGAGVTTTLVLGTDYTVQNYDTSTGLGGITLTLPPALTDTIIVQGGQCLDPLSVVRKFSPRLLDVNLKVLPAPTLDCPKLNFSSTSLREDSGWWTNCNTANVCVPGFTTSLLSIQSLSIPDGGEADGTRMINGVKYRQLNFSQPYIHLPYSKYYMDYKGGPNFEGRTFYLDEDPGPPNGTYRGITYNDAAVPPMNPNNKKHLKIYKTLCSHLNDVAPGSCTDALCVWGGENAWFASHVGDGVQTDFDTGVHKFVYPVDLIVKVTPNGGTEALMEYDKHYTVTGGDTTTLCPGSATNICGAVGSIRFKPLYIPPNLATVRIERNRCSSKTAILLVEEPPGGLTPQNNLRYAVYGERYLAGTTIDAKGVIQPICKDLEIKPPAVSNTCANNKTVRAVNTDGTIECNP